MTSKAEVAGDDVVVGHYVSVIIPNEAGAGARGDLLNVQAERILTATDPGDVDDRGRGLPIKRDRRLFVFREVTPRRDRRGVASGFNPESGSRGQNRQIKTPPRTNSNTSGQIEPRAGLRGGYGS